jgi:hypothetical protein
MIIIIMRTYNVALLLASFFAVAIQANGQHVMINTEVRSRSLDAKGKVTYADWKNYNTLLVENITGYKTDIARTSLYGGDLSVKGKKTGFFHTEKIGDRWWCIDPEGYGYINTAVNSIVEGASIRNKTAFKQKFSSDAEWMKQTAAMLQQNGFTCAGSWSDHEKIRQYNKTAKQPLAYTVMLNFMSSYGNKRGGTYRQPGHTGYPKNVIFIFDPEFEAFCDEHAKQVVAWKDDRNLFGYFSDNEMPYRISYLDSCLAFPPTDNAYKAAMKWLKENNVQAENITDSDRIAFLVFAAEKYFAIVNKALKKYDPNHMYIGCRFHNKERNIQPFMEAAGRYMDIVSINYYREWTPVAGEMDNWSKWTGKPFIVTEFYVKAEDTGLGNISGAGWIVRTQKDRGDFYQNWCIGLLQAKNCVGWHWFKYIDNDPSQLNAEPSNTDANKGIVNNDYMPYEDLLKRMKQLNDERYGIIRFLDTKK